MTQKGLVMLMNDIIWRIIPLHDPPGPYLMALDEAILEGIAAGTSPPTIRFYTWTPKAVTIGTFQGLHYEVNIEECKARHVDVIRRITGGGAVYHDDEITYSILGPEHLFPKDIIASYKEICGCVVAALKSLGIAAVFSPINDVLVTDPVEGDRKISGSAQTRRNGVLLQHGTILYTVDVDTMFTLLTPDKAKISDKLIQSVKKRVTCVKEYGTATREELAEALEHAFIRGKNCTRGTYTEKELLRAKVLVKEKYATDEWNALR
jgi:lipoate-protein ligase A